LGKMSGQGTMTWKDSGSFEQYCGLWENNQPQGMGTHTWHAPEPRPDPNGKEGPTQQMNNRYHGEWNGGLRHGEGSFYYANGAKFNGSWTDNVKHGQGRYTFEDGKVYSGAFVNDQMKDYVQPESLQRMGALNIGAEDNPIRRCIDVTDLEPFALPLDVGGMDFSQGGGFDDAQEVMREVYNMLLRYLGELKQVYCQYRKILPRQGEDPFVLSMHQVWMLARDFDLLTPSCSLSAFNRCILSGPRHHQEATSEEENSDLRPLTPRREPSSYQHKRASTNDRIDSRASPTMCNDASNSQLSADGKHQEHALSVNEDVDDGGSSECTGCSTIAHSRDDTEAEQQIATEQDGLELEQKTQSPRNQNSILARTSLRSSNPTIVPPYSRFWRNEDASDLVNIHSPTGILMFRHFIELFVRVALVRYPHEKGIERQVRRLFKETLAPRFGKTGSDTPLSLLLDTDIQTVFGDVGKELWDVFKAHVVGEGAYGPPLGASHVAIEETEKTNTALDDSVKDAKPELGTTSNANASPLDTSSRNCAASPTRLRRHGIGGQQRRLHVKARMDATIRVKDLLRLLDNAGFLLPPGPKDKLPPYAVDIHSSVFLSLDEPEDPSQFQKSQESFMADLGGLKGLLSAESPWPGDGQQDLATEGTSLVEVEKKTAPIPSNSPAPLALDAARGADVADTTPPAAQQNASAEHPATDVLNCNFTLTMLEVLRLALEVLSPTSIEKLCWAVRGDDSPMDQRVAILDFVESELSFCEFQRLLLRISERKTKDLARSSDMPLHRRLEGFLKHVFLPSLEKPYELPKKEDCEVSTAQVDTSRQPLDGTDDSKDQQVVSDMEIQQTREEVVQDVHKFEIWQGFEGSDLHEQEEMGALRVWPEEYESRIADWE